MARQKIPGIGHRYLNQFFLFPPLGTMDHNLFAGHLRYPLAEGIAFLNRLGRQNRAGNKHLPGIVLLQKCFHHLHQGGIRIFKQKMPAPQQMPPPHEHHSQLTHVPFLSDADDILIRHAAGDHMLPFNGFPNGVNPVPDLGGFFKIESNSRFRHVHFQDSHQLRVTAFQKKAHLLNHFPIDFLAYRPRARGQTAVHLEVDTGPLPVFQFLTLALPELENP